MASLDDAKRAYDLVIGADGLHSQIRELLFPDVKPKLTGQVVWRYNLPRIEGLDKIRVYIGPTGTAGFVPLADDLMYMLTIEKPPEGTPLRLPREGLAATYRERLAGFGGPVAEQRELIVDDDAVVYRPVENVVVPAPWYRDNVVLIGDAAHATSPHCGQGAAQAIEDALVLTQELSSRDGAGRGARRVHGAPLRALPLHRRGLGGDRRVGDGPLAADRPDREAPGGRDGGHGAAVEMRIARVEHDGAVRAAIVTPEADSVRVLPPEVGVSDLLAGDRDRLAALAREEVAIDAVRLLSPVQPPTIRDFSVFEQHVEGVVKLGSPDATVPDVWYASPFCYFSNPHAVTGPDDEIAVPPGCAALDLELEVAAIIGRPGTNLRPEDGRRAHRGLHDLQRLVGPRPAACRARARPRLLQGEGLREHARSVDRHRGRARAVPQRRSSRPRPPRVDQRRGARERHAGEHGVELGGARLIRVARHVGPDR